MRRNLWVVAGVVAALNAALAAVLLASVPGEIAARLLTYLLVNSVALVGVTVLACHLADGWPGLLRVSFVARTWGVDPAALSNAAMRQRAGTRAHWRAALRGLAVGAAAAAVVGLLWWAVSGLVPSFGGLNLLLVGPIIASTRGSAVRQAVSEKLAATPAVALP